VSPELIFSASVTKGSVGAAAAGAAAAVLADVAADSDAADGAATVALAGASSAHAMGTPQARRQRRTNRDDILISENPFDF